MTILFFLLQLLFPWGENTFDKLYPLKPKTHPCETIRPPPWCKEGGVEW